MSNKIKKYLIKSTPVGEIKELLKDLSKALPDFKVDDPEIIQAIKDYTEEHFGIFPGDTFKYLVNPFTAKDNYYIDQKTRNKVYIDFLANKIMNVEPLIIENEDLMKYVAEIDKKVAVYVRNYFKDSEVAHLVHGEGTLSDFNILILISCKNYNFKNFLGGEWLSEWRIKKTSYEGKVRINAHYFEDGNVQLKQSKIFKEAIKLSGSDFEKDASVIVDTISKNEEKLQVSLDVMYEDMPDNIFKAMRRALPITNTKMEWNLQLQSMLTQLNKK